MEKRITDTANNWRVGAGVVLAVVVLFGLVGCWESTKTPPQPNPPKPNTTVAPAQEPTANLTGAGATFPNPIYTKWFDVFGTNSPTVKINYQAVGSGAGIKQLQAGTVDFGASDAPLSDDEVKQMPASVVHIPTVAGAVVLAYNIPDVPAGLKLNGDVIAGIYLGDIKKWNDPQIVKLNPDMKLPDLAITVAYRSDGSGTTYIYTHYLSAISKTWLSKVGSGKSVSWPVGVGGKGNDGVAGVVKQTSGGIGYVELAYAVQNKLTFADVQNQSGKFITPSITSTTAAAAGAEADMQKDVRVSIVNSAAPDAYPICGFTYILLYTDQKDADKGKALIDLLWWAIHDGQQYTDALLYAKLPTSVVTLNEKALGTITANGKPIRSK